LLTIREGSSPADRRFEWRWAHGSEIKPSDFGDPQTSTDYTLCVYDDDPQSLTGARLLASATAAGGNSNWSQTRRGYRYGDQSLATDGLERIVLRSGTVGMSRIVVSGKGSRFDVADLPGAPPIVAELRSSNGKCWRSEYTALRINTPEKMHAREKP
jgi:hypothetical protein